ncbi:hypothetical protein HDG37_001144 [Paraburkholderia sp. MM5384-R2]|nr:hypothetical protein [Paraburkholderia sp. MM5384-R2]
MEDDPGGNGQVSVSDPPRAGRGAQPHTADATSHDREAPPAFIPDHWTS